MNGEILPVAATVQRSDFPEENFAIFPHILTRNYSFDINLGQKEEPWFPPPALLKGYSFLNQVEDKVAGPSRPETRSECEVKKNVVNRDSTWEEFRVGSLGNTCNYAFGISGYIDVRFAGIG